MLGSDLVAELASFYEVCGLGKQANRNPEIPYVQTDITNRAGVLKAVRSLKPAIIVHAAAWTDVDGCERNPQQAFLVNVKGTEFVAEASDGVGAALFFISSDYVFDGTKPSAYEEQDFPNPVNVYGRSKFEAEEFLKKFCRSAWMIRSSWLFGRNGKNFFRAILHSALEKQELRVVDDQRGAPTYTKHLAKGLRALIEKGTRVKGSIAYHLANEGETTWFQAAKKLLAKTNSKNEVKPISSQELARPAKRPSNSVLNMTKIKKAYGIQLPSWEQGFDEFWNESLEKEWQSLIVSRKN